MKKKLRKSCVKVCPSKDKPKGANNQPLLKGFAVAPCKNLAIAEDVHRSFTDSRHRWNIEHLFNCNIIRFVLKGEYYTLYNIHYTIYNIQCSFALHYTKQGILRSPWRCCKPALSSSKTQPAWLSLQAACSAFKAFSGQHLYILRSAYMFSDQKKCFNIRSAYMFSGAGPHRVPFVMRVNGWHKIDLKKNQPGKLAASETSSWSLWPLCSNAPEAYFDFFNISFPLYLYKHSLI